MYAQAEQHIPPPPHSCVNEDESSFESSDLPLTYER